MSSLARRVSRLALIYVVCIPVLVALGFVNENLAHAFLLISSAFLASRLIYELWKDSQNLEDIRYPSQEETPRWRELEFLTRSVERAIAGRKESCRVVISHLRWILLKKVRFRLGMTWSEADQLQDNPEKLRGIVNDEELLKLLVHGEPEKQNEWLESLNRILGKLEDW